MPVPRDVRGRLARFVLLLTLLMLPWPGLGRFYAGAIAGLASTALGNANANVTLRFTVPATATPVVAGQPWQLNVFAEDTITGQFVQTALDARRSGYIASAVFVALALATPVRWSRRLGVLLVGLALLQTLPLLPLLSFFSGKLPVRVFDLGAVARSIIEIAYHTLVAPPGMAYAVPGLLWLLLVGAMDPGCLRLWSLPGRKYHRERT
jgi:hypothetical protein